MLVASAAHAQALTAYGGRLRLDDGQHAFTGAVSYTERVWGPLEAGFQYLNEGHPRDHHRDGFAVEWWLRTPQFGPRLTLGVGAGPYYHFDTVHEGGEFTNHHGLGLIYSAEAQWYWNARWFLALRANRVRGLNSFDTHAVLLGVGYRWEASLLDEPPAIGIAPHGGPEINVLAGQSFVNSFASQRSTVIAIDYRRSVRRWLDWSVTALHEADTRVLRRNGIATQLWLVRYAHDDRISLGAGLGPYAVLDRHSPESHKNSVRLTGLISVSARYAVTPRWHVRASFNRVLTNYHRDADLYLAGVGYAF
jgi:hypothetical protein